MRDDHALQAMRGRGEWGESPLSPSSGALGVLGDGPFFIPFFLGNLKGVQKEGRDACDRKQAIKARDVFTLRSRHGVLRSFARVTCSVRASTRVYVAAT